MLFWLHFVLFTLYCVTSHDAECSLFIFRSNTDTDSSDNPVICEAKDFFMCSVALKSTESFVTVVTVSISDAVAPPIHLKVPQTPGEKIICFLFNSFWLPATLLNITWNVHVFGLNCRKLEKSE